MEAVTNEGGEFKMSDSMKRDIKDKDKVLTPLITKCRKCGVRMTEKQKSEKKT